MRYEAVQGQVYDRETDRVVQDYRRDYVAPRHANRLAEADARNLNNRERESREIDRMMRSNQGVL